MKFLGLLFIQLALLLFMSSRDSASAQADDPNKPDKPANPAKPREPVKLTEVGLRIHKEALLIDGHNDLPWQFREKKDLSFRKIDLLKNQNSLHTDIPRLLKGNVGAQFWAA